MAKGEPAMSSAKAYRHFLPWQNGAVNSSSTAGPDDRSGNVYLHDPHLQLATETAIVTQRALLIRGEPGSGKSSFAAFAARNLGWRYYEINVTGRTEAKDLLWRFDALARLRDAQIRTQPNINPHRYVTPGVLWWAFNRESVERLRSDEKTDESLLVEPFAEVNSNRDPSRSVVLVDEIDKADPEVPNDLLEVFGLNRFNVEDLQLKVERKSPDLFHDPDSANHYGSLLIVITTNQERDLPSAFLRRCIVYSIQEPEKTEEQVIRLERIARLHFNSWIESQPKGANLVLNVAQKCCELRKMAKKHRRRGPSTAEFLDAVRVCFTLQIGPDSDLWKQVEQSVVLKDMDASGND
jgi:MoxR-like ATPase